MKSRHSSTLAISAIMTAAFTITAQAQGVRVGSRLIPESSIEHVNDIGRRAHTHVQILVGRPGGGIKFMGGLGPYGGLTPAQLRQAYNLPATGGSQIIAIVDAYDNPNALADFNTFSANYGLPQESSASVTNSTNKVFQVLYAGGVKPATDSTGGWELEEALDIQWAHAMAPNAKILLVEAADTSFTSLLSAVDNATSYKDGNGLTVKEVSNSWGGSEFNGEDEYDSHFTGSSATYFVSAGDAGAGAQYPSASPYVVSAGGTSVTTDASGNFVSESGWSEGGGGPSAFELQTLFQKGVAGLLGGFRGTPDISFDADPLTGVSVYDSFPYEGVSYGWAVIGGTSVASPSLAGIANNAATAQGQFPAGSQALLANIYANLGSANFRDITSGNNGYAAGPGWDFVTGVGVCIGLSGLQASNSIAPSISNLNPVSATAGGPTLTLTVNGAGFVNGSTVNWKGAALTTTFVSATQITASVPAADIAVAGTAGVTVANPGNAASASATFTINAAPVITSLNPGSVTAGSATFTLTVSGSGFVSGSTVNWKGAALTTTFVSATQITASVPAADIAVAGTAGVTVANPGGAASASATFTINAAPVITSLNPGSVTAGSATFTLTVSGSGFVSGSTVDWNGAALTTTFVSATQITASVPAADVAAAGTASVTVANPGGAASASATFTINAAPVITSLNPGSVTAGSATFTLTVSGSGFVSGSTVNWNGAALTTTFVSATQITASVPAADVAAAGTANVTVANPGGVQSASATFTINAALAITSLNPNSVTAGSPSFTLTVSGSGFVSGSTVKWAGNALPTTHLSPTQLTAQVPATYIASAGSAAITVVNPGGATSNSATITINTIITGPPVISYLSPNSATHGSGQLSMAVVGSHFTTSSRIYWTSGTQFYALTMAYVSSSELVALVPSQLLAKTGTAAIYVMNPVTQGGSSAPQTFTIK